MTKTELSLIKPLVFGGIDGLTTTLALVWGSMAAGEHLVSSQVVIILGVAQLMATAFSMGIGDYVGTIAEYEAQQQDGDLLKNLSVKAAALRSGITMFLSFLVFGGVPLIPYFPSGLAADTRRGLATLLCAFSFFALGAVRATLERRRDAMLKMSTNMLLMGTGAALISFGSSKAIYWLLGAAESEGRV